MVLFVVIVVVEAEAGVAELAAALDGVEDVGGGCDAAARVHGAEGGARFEC